MKNKGTYNQCRELTVKMALSQAVKAASAAMYLALLQATPIWSGRIEVSLLLASKSLAAWYVANFAPSVRYLSQQDSYPENRIAGQFREFPPPSSLTTQFGM